MTLQLKRAPPPEARAAASKASDDVLGSTEASKYQNETRVSTGKSSVARVSGLHLRMGRRRNEAIRILRRRQSVGEAIIDPLGAALVLADTLVFGRKGLDFLTIGEAAKAAWMTIRDDLLMQAVHRVGELAERKGKAYRPLSDERAGQLLRVTTAELIECAGQDRLHRPLPVSTIAAIDETAIERRKRVTTNRRARDRERDRRKRAGSEAKPRAMYEAESLSQLRPWEELGISRRTWERRRAKGGEGLATRRLSQVPPRSDSYRKGGEALATLAPLLGGHVTAILLAVVHLKIIATSGPGAAVADKGRPEGLGRAAGEPTAEGGARSAQARGGQ